MKFMRVAFVVVCACICVSFFLSFFLRSFSFAVIDAKTLRTGNFQFTDLTASVSDEKVMRRAVECLISNQYFIFLRESGVDPGPDIKIDSYDIAYYFPISYNGLIDLDVLSGYLYNEYADVYWMARKYETDANFRKWIAHMVSIGKVTPAELEEMVNDQRGYIAFKALRQKGWSGDGGNAVSLGP